MQLEDIKSEDDVQPARILARQLSRELEDQELDAVAGGIWLGTRCPDGARDAYC